MVGTSLLLQGCLGTRYLQENECLLVSQRVKGNKEVKQEALAPYYQQQSNRRLLAMPVWLWIHELGKGNFDTTAIEKQLTRIEAKYTKKMAAAAGNPRKLGYLRQQRDKKVENKKRLLKEGNFLMRWGEPPVIYNPQQKDLTEQNSLHYLQTKGYFDAQVSSTVKLRHKKAYITYQIKENKPYLIREIQLTTPDTAIQQLLQPYQQQSLIQQGNNYDQDVLTRERERIQDLLSSHGYFNFSKQYVSFNVDTTGTGHTVAIETVITLPSGSSAHSVYHIDSVVFAIEPKQHKQATEDIITCRGITFKALHQNFNPPVLASKIPLRPTQLYKGQDIIETQKVLSRLDMFRYVNIAHDTTGSGSLITYIHTSPLDRFQLSNEIGVQVSKESSNPHPFYELSLKSRNLFKRLETLAISTQVSLEGVATSANKQPFYNSQAFDINLGLIVPQLLLPLRSKTHTQLDTYKPVTKLSIGYTFTSRPDYTRSNIKSLLSYDWQGSGNASYELTPISIDLIDSRVSKQFQEELAQRKAEGNNLYRIYQPSLVSSLSFKTILRNNRVAGAYPPCSYLALLFESGGALQNLLDLRKLISKQLAYYRYVKFNLAYSQHIPIQPSTILAYQITTGIAYPYDEYKVLPHEKYYFAGGTNSIRAWYPRTLGPGSYNANAEEATQQPKEQPGELTVQGSVELRQQLVGFIEGALFVDIGNVWMIHKGDRVGGDFSFKRFYKEIAIGTGTGLRLNFKFIVLRFDVGVKLYDPAKPLGYRLFPTGTFQQLTTFNIGLGYPF